ncbi:MAG: phosphopantetheine-binding protein, partial [Myxococcota bacterium]
MMTPMAEPLRLLMASVPLRAPRVPFVSNVTGTWITDEQAQSPDYWVRHLLECVRFADGVNTLARDTDAALLEVGPGRMLSTLARQSGVIEGRPAVSCVRHPNDPRSDYSVLLAGLGALWTAGIEADWAAVQQGERRRRRALPTYPLERERLWVSVGPLEAQAVEAAPPSSSVSSAPKAAPEAPAPTNGVSEPALGERSLEDTLAELWRDALGAKKVRSDDNFFALGGDSVMAIQIAVNARKLGIEFKAKDLFRYQTVATLAEHLGDAAGSAASSGVSSADASSSTLSAKSAAGSAPLLPMQSWFLDGAGETADHFDLGTLLRLDSAPDEAALERATAALIARHEGLRVRLTTERGEPRMKVASSDTMSLEET